VSRDAALQYALKKYGPRLMNILARAFTALCLVLVCAVPARAESGRQIHINSIGMEFVLISAGSFFLEHEVMDGQGTPRRPKVTISKAFYLGQYPVTQEQWETVIGSNPSQFKGWNRPVENVSWRDVQEFIRRLNELEGHERYRLPTEMEWEYAARGGTASKYFFMEDPRTWEEAELPLKTYAWFNKNSHSSTRPVGKKKPNPYGLYDMYGNVWEWVQDRFAVKPPNLLEMRDYAGPAASPWNNRERVLRGGSFGLSGPYSRSGSRRSLTPDYRHNDIGFRLALTPEEIIER